MKRLNRRYSKTTANKALTIAKKNRKLLGTIERKFIFRIHDAAVFDNLGLYQSLNLIAQGDNPGQREGHKIQFESLFLKGYCVIPSAVNVAVVRIMIVLDKQANGTSAQADDWLHNVTQFQQLVSQVPPDRQTRFNVLYDKTMAFDNDSGNGIIKFQKYIKVNKRIDYSDGTSNSTSLRSKNVIFGIWTDILQASLDKPIVVSSVLVKYTDL